MELLLTNSSTIPTNISVPSVLLQIFTGLQTVQLNTSQPQVLLQILPQPHGHFIQGLQQTDRGKHLVEENKALRLRAEELLDSVVHIQNVVEEFKEQTQAASKQTTSIVERLRRNQKLVNTILEQHGNPNGTSLDSSQQACSECLVQESEISFGDPDLGKNKELNNADNKEVNEVSEEECFHSGTKEKLYSLVKELRDLQLQADNAAGHLHIIESNALANRTWLYKGLENCLYFQEASKQKDDLITELREKIESLQRTAGSKEIHPEEGKYLSDDFEDLRDQLSIWRQVADERGQLLQEIKDQIDELKVAKDQLQQYQNLAEERGVQLDETNEQLHHFQQLAEVRQLMLLEAKENLAELKQQMEENSTNTEYAYSYTEWPIPQVQKLVDGRQHLPTESIEVSTVGSKNQAVGSIMNSHGITEEENSKARLHALLAGRSKETALLDAAGKGNVEQIVLLLDFGANIHARDSTRKQTALMKAAERGHLEATRVLIQRGASLEAHSTGWYNLTALLYAAANKHLDVVKLLVEAGADITAVDSLGKTVSVLGGKEIQNWLEGR